MMIFENFKVASRKHSCPALSLQLSYLQPTHENAYSCPARLMLSACFRQAQLYCKRIVQGPALPLSGFHQLAA
jgi:hypothetical protein